MYMWLERWESYKSEALRWRVRLKQITNASLLLKDNILDDGLGVCIQLKL